MKKKRKALIFMIALIILSSLSIMIGAWKTSHLSFSDFTVIGLSFMMGGMLLSELFDIAKKYNSGEYDEDGQGA